LRRMLAALCTRENVIERQVLCMLVLAAILAAIAVANVDARALHRSFAAIASKVNVMTQADDRRDRERDRRRMEHIIAVILFDKDGPAKMQTHRAGNADRAKRLV